MDILRQGFLRFTPLLFVILPGIASLPAHVMASHTVSEQQLVDLTNQSRSAEGLSPVQWDPALAAAARAHALRMAQEGPIAHRYGGEPDLAERASNAGAHFSLVEENIAVGDSPAQIHDAWMHSQGHHDNLLNRRIDRIGVAIVPVRGVLYAVADYAQGVQVLSPGQVEDRVAAIVAVRGVELLSDAGSVSTARQYCALDEGYPPGTPSGQKPRFMMRWQSSEIAQLPSKLAERVASGRYRQAAVGACTAKSGDNTQQAAFTAYRVAVLLY